MRYTGNAASDPNSTFPIGEYFLTCTHVQDKDEEGNDLVSKSGNNMWILEFTVSEGPHKDRKMWHYLVWLKAGKPGHGMTLKSLKAFGIDPEGDNDILPQHLLNVTVKCDVKIDEGDGQFDPKNVVRKWHNPGELSKPGTVATDEEAGTAQEPDEATSFDPKELEKPAPKPAPAGAKKNPWGGKK